MNLIILLVIAYVSVGILLRIIVRVLEKKPSKKNIYEYSGESLLCGLFLIFIPIWGIMELHDWLKDKRF